MSEDCQAYIVDRSWSEMIQNIYLKEELNFKTKCSYFQLLFLKSVDEGYHGRFHVDF